MNILHDPIQEQMTLMSWFFLVNQKPPERPKYYDSPITDLLV